MMILLKAVLRRAARGSAQKINIAPGVPPENGGVRYEFLCQNIL